MPLDTLYVIIDDPTNSATALKDDGKTTTLRANLTRLSPVKR